MQHKIYNIPAGLPFSKTLVRYLHHLTRQDGARPLPEYTILLPTRRACRILRETFLSMNSGAPMLLPRMTPLGDVDEEDLSLMMFGNAQDFLDVPPAIDPMKRLLLLAKLVGSAKGFTQGPDHALMLAAALAKFIDQVVVEELSFADLHKIVPEDFSEHWKITLEFLKIISEHWPSILEANNVIDVAQRRNILMQALADHWRKSPPDYPVIAAGSTGSIPAAGRLLNVIATMPTGQIILPGLDIHMDETAWGYVGESHPQHGLKTLLSRMETERSDVRELGIDHSDLLTSDRNKLASAMMLPAQVTATWKEFGKVHDLEPMLEHLEYYACATQQEEAAAIGLLMREALEGKENITALVTPDRTLARRVSAQCRRWGIEVDDSAGQNLADTRLGKFISLTMQMAKAGYDVVSMLALLKISLCRFGQDDIHYDKMVNMLEQKFLRTKELTTSHEMLRTKIKKDETASKLFEFMEGFYAALKPLSFYGMQTGKQPFAEILKAHVKVLEALATTTDQAGQDILWRGDIGETAALFLSELLSHDDLLEDMSFTEYEKIITSLMSTKTVRSAYGVHPRLLILGQLEARLADADLVILGGLNEGVWPPDAAHDPWMSRPMRGDFGLPGTDQTVGIAAHDFVQGFCAGRVVMTRSEKVDGSPTVPARWLDRLDTVLKASGRSLNDLSTGAYLHWAKTLDMSDAPKPADRPKPKPPLSTRPFRASVTKIDVWMKDPYAIYAYYVLGLKKLDPLVQDSDAALRGTIIHDILEAFVTAYPDDLPDDAEDRFLDIVRDILTEKLESPDLLQYWGARFYKIAAWFVAHENCWRHDAQCLKSEISGEIDIDVDGIPFTVHGKADRIDKLPEGYALIDYKTGGQYKESSFKKGEYPQLPLEAIMLAGGGFTKSDIPKGDAAYLGYWKVTGARTAGEVVALSGDLDETIEIVLEGLKGVIRAFRDIETPFFAVPDHKNAPRYNDYELLSRYKEWAVLDEETGEAA